MIRVLGLGFRFYFLGSSELGFWVYVSVFRELGITVLGLGIRF